MTLVENAGTGPSGRLDYMVAEPTVTMGIATSEIPHKNDWTTNPDGGTCPNGP